MDKNLKTPKISVLLPVYNGGEYLQAAIDSILNQSYSDFEFIIINDASTDDSEKLICSYTDSRIRYVKNEENLGLIKTLNKGLDLCNGDYIVRMDQDDIANDKRLEKQNNILDQNLEIGVCGSWFTLFGTRNNHIVKHPEHHEHIKIGMLAYCAIGHPTVMIRKSALQGLKYDEDYQAAEDYEFWTRLLRITKFYNIQESLLDYRLHETNMSVKENSTQAINTRRIVENQLAYIGLDRNLDFVKYCYILFREYNPRVSSEEFIKLVSFANLIENANLKKQFYDSIILRKTINKKISGLYKNIDINHYKLPLALYKNKGALKTKISLKYNLKLINSINLGRNKLKLIKTIFYKN